MLCARLLNTHNTYSEISWTSHHIIIERLYWVNNLITILPKIRSIHEMKTILVPYGKAKMCCVQLSLTRNNRKNITITNYLSK